MKRAMLIAAAATLLASHGLCAQQTLHDYAGVTVENRTGDPLSRTVLTIDDPATLRMLTTSKYGVAGRLAAEGVEGDGYMELWSYFDGGERFFSRALDERGPMGRLTGTVGDRPFTLPFYMDRERSGTGPRKIEVNVVLPGKGRVVIRSMELVRFDESQEPTSYISGQWFDGAAAGVLGGIAGTLIGLLGALIGCFSTRLAARRLVSLCLSILLVEGALFAAAAVFAIVRHQPWFVWCPLLGIGAISLISAVMAGPSIRRRYIEAELRKMRSMDATRG